MQQVATINPMWAGKWILAALAALGIAAWCAYDAAVAYPEHNRRVEAFETHRQEDRLGEWAAYAADRGWSDDEPGQAMTESDTFTQWLMFSVFAALGLAALGWWLRHLGTSVAADDEGLIGPRGQRVSWGQITDLDLARWDKSGIAFVRYEIDQRPGIIRLDDWLYVNVEPIVKRIQQQTGLGDVAEP